MAEDVCVCVCLCVCVCVCVREIEREDTQKVSFVLVRFTLPVNKTGFKRACL